MKKALIYRLHQCMDQTHIGTETLGPVDGGIGGGVEAIKVIQPAIPGVSV